MSSSDRTDANLEKSTDKSETPAFFSSREKGKNSRSTTPEPPRLNFTIGEGSKRQPSRLRLDSRLFQPTAEKHCEHAPPGLMLYLFQNQKMCRSERVLLVNRLATENTSEIVSSILRATANTPHLREDSLHKHGQFLYTINNKGVVRIYAPVDQMLEAQIGRHYPVSLNQLPLIAKHWVIESSRQAIHSKSGPITCSALKIPPEIQTKLHINYIALDYVLGEPAGHHKLINTQLIYDAISINGERALAEGGRNGLGIEFNPNTANAADIFCNHNTLYTLKKTDPDSTEFIALLQKLKQRPLLLYCQEDPDLSDSEDESYSKPVKFNISHLNNKKHCLGRNFIFYDEVVKGEFKITYTPPHENEMITLDPTNLPKTSEAISLAIKEGDSDIQLPKDFYLSANDKKRMALLEKYRLAITISQQFVHLLLNLTPLTQIRKKLLVELINISHHNIDNISNSELKKAIPIQSEKTASLAQEAMDYIIDSAAEGHDLVTKIVSALIKCTECKSLVKSLETCRENIIKHTVKVPIKLTA